MGNNTVTKISASEAQRTKTEIHALLNQYALSAGSRLYFRFGAFDNPLTGY